MGSQSKSSSSRTSHAVSIARDSQLYDQGKEGKEEIRSRNRRKRRADVAQRQKNETNEEREEWMRRHKKRKEIGK